MSDKEEQDLLREFERSLEAEESEDDDDSDSSEDLSDWTWTEEVCSNYPYVVAWYGGLHVRSRPSLKAESLGVLPLGTIIYPKARTIRPEGKWYHHEQGWTLKQSYEDDPPVELLSKFSRPSYIVRFDFDKITIHKKPTELSDYFEDEAPPTDKLYPKRKAFDANGTKWIMLKKDEWVKSSCLEVVDNKRQRLKILFDLWWPKLKLLLHARVDADLVAFHYKNIDAEWTPKKTRVSIPLDIIHKIGLIGVLWDSELRNITEKWRKERRPLKVGPPGRLFSGRNSQEKLNITTPVDKDQEGACIVS